MPVRRRGGQTAGQWISRAASDVGNFLKRTKILSTLGKAITPMLPEGKYKMAGSAATSALEQMGLGRRRRVVRRRRVAKRGAGPRMDKFLSGLKKANTFARDNQLFSRGLNMLSSSGLVKNPNVMKASNIAKSIGYGRRMGGGSLRPAGGALRLSGARRY